VKLSLEYASSAQNHKFGKFFYVSILILLQFQLGHIFNFPVTTALLVLPIVILSLFKIQIKPIAALVFISINLILVINFITNTNIDTFSNFIKASTLIIVNSLAFAILVSGDVKPHIRLLDSAVVWTMYLNIVLSVIQLTLGYRTYPVLARIFGIYTNDFQFIPDLHASINRPSAFYIEPSFNALISLCLFAAITLLPNIKNRGRNITVCLIYTILTFSVAGILSLFSILLIARLARGRFRKADVLFLLFSLILVFRYVYGRILTLGYSGSSSNFRIVSPYRLVLKELNLHPMGIPVGTLRDVMADAGFLNGSTVGTSLDNGWFLLLLYFGFFGLILLSFMIAATIYFCHRLRKHNEPFWTVGLIPILSLGFTGGIFLPDYAVILGIVIYSIRVRLSQNNDSNVNYNYFHSSKSKNRT
jgi:putative colanic acid polymerase